MEFLHLVSSLLIQCKEIIYITSSNDLSIHKWLRHFSGAVAVSSKGGLIELVAVWAVAAYICAVTVSMWDVTSSMSEVTASMHDVKVICGLLHPLCGPLQAPCGLL